MNNKHQNKKEISMIANDHAIITQSIPRKMFRYKVTPERNYSYIKKTIIPYQIRIKKQN